MDARQKQICQQSEQLEAARIRFLETSRGRTAALAFAQQTRNSYRHAVLTRTAPAGEEIFRLRLIGSYRYLRRYIAAAQQPPL
ncbi:MAG TPA: hypothetical protein VFY81_00140 [Gammaproteobacteria bacterium]|nr:hypothetical protein [Gammaproteobacteria bacterium]